MGVRRQARECALQMLYQLDMGKNDLCEVMDLYWQTQDVDEGARMFANELVNGVADHRSSIDKIIASNSQHWKLSRMAAVDKNVLRIAIFELIYRPDIPAKVTINEAVEVAKRYGTSDSGAFVNGILDSVAKEVEGKDEQSAISDC